MRRRRGPRILIDDASFTIFPGDTVGIVARNGCGQSTLVALVRDELGTDAGGFDRPARRTVVSVLQELPATGAAVPDGDTPPRRIDAAIVAAHEGTDGKREAELLGE